MKVIKYNAYEFDELGENAKFRAINDQITCEIEMADENSIVWDSIVAAEKMLTPWFTGEYVYDMHKDHIIELCKEYLYFEKGDVVPYDILKED